MRVELSNEGDEATPIQNHNNNSSTATCSNDTSISSTFPNTVLAILLTETAERFAYYGYRAILVLYFIEELKLNETTAISLFAYTTSLAYIMPLFGAVLSDAFFGKYKIIIMFGWTYALGVGLLTTAAYDILPASSSQRALTVVGLILICIGTGGIKPCVSPFGADQLLYSVTNALQHSSQSSSFPLRESASEECYEFDHLPSSSSSFEESQQSEKFDVTFSSSENSNEELIQKFFSWFYFGINVGSLASFLIVPTIKANYGFGTAFLLPTIFIIIAMIVFSSKKSDYIILTPENGNSHNHGQEGTSLVSVLRIYRRMIQNRKDNRPHYQPASQNRSMQSKSSIMEYEMRSNYAGIDVNAQEIQDAHEVLRVMPVLAAFPIFWMLYDQQGSVWILQANHMNLHGIQPEQLGVLNPLFIMILIPIFDQYVYPWCQRNGWSITHLRRISWGMGLAALSFFISGFLESAVETGYQEANDKSSEDDTKDFLKVNVMWQIPQIFILSVAEILVSITGLEFAYANSPPSMKALIMATFQLTTAVGDLFGGALYSILRVLNRNIILHICGGLMIMNLIIFRQIERRWDRTSQEQ